MEGWREGGQKLFKELSVDIVKRKEQKKNGNLWAICESETTNACGTREREREKDPTLLCYYPRVHDRSMRCDAVPSSAPSMESTNSSRGMPIERYAREDETESKSFGAPTCIPSWEGR